MSVSASMISARKLATLDLPPLVPVVYSLLYEGVTLLAGPPKLGKSFLATFEFARAVATGEPFLGHFPSQRGHVLCLALEDGLRRLKERQQRVFGSELAPEGLTYATSWPRLGAGCKEELENWLSENPLCRLVVIDTLARIRSARGNAATDKYQRDYDAMAELHALALAHHVALLVVTHTRKRIDAVTDFLEEVSGTLGLPGAADSVMVLRRGRTRSDATLQVTGRDIAEQELALDFDAQAGRWRLVGRGASGTLSPARRQVYDFLRRVSPGTAGPKVIARELGSTEAAVKDHLKELALAGLAQNRDRGGWTVAVGQE